MRTACLLLSLAYTALTQTRVNDDLILPGVRVGPVTRTSTEQSLRQALGRLAVKGNVDIGEGVDEPGLILYPADPTRRLEILWNEDRPAHPARVFICRSERNGDCRWRTAQGFGIGTTLRELEKANGRPFEMVGWGSDVGGNLTSFQEGRLAKLLGAISLTLTPRIDHDGSYLPKLTAGEFDEVEGEKFLLSSHPVLQKLNPYVAALSMVFPVVERH